MNLSQTGTHSRAKFRNNCEIRVAQPHRETVKCCRLELFLGFGIWVLEFGIYCDELMLHREMHQFPR